MASLIRVEELEESSTRGEKRNEPVMGEKTTDNEIQL